MSINRFEDKKDLGLILEAFILFKRSDSYQQTQTSPRLVIAGGYDPRLADNRETLARLRAILDAPDAPSYALYDGNSTCPTESPDVLLVPNIAESDKRALLLAPSTYLLAYTAANEHLGIGPLEAMAAGLPVLAADSGGPRETVSHGLTGELQPPVPAVWADALTRLMAMSDLERAKMAEAGRARARSMFSTQAMVEALEVAMLETLHQPGNTNIWHEERLYKSLAVITVPIIAFWVAIWALWMHLT